MHGGFHFHRDAIEHEAARKPARPHVERLASCGYVTEDRRLPAAVRQIQAEPPQRETMRVLAQPLHVGLLCLLPVAQVRVLLRLAPHFDGHFSLREREAFRIRKAVPGPLRLGHERHERRILLRKGLQPGDVRRERQVPVAHHERRGLVDRGDRGVVAGDQRVPVDGSAFCPGRYGEQHPGRNDDSVNPGCHGDHLCLTAATAQLWPVCRE